MSRPDGDVLEVLGDIERAEARLLTWGVVDGAMSESELLEEITASIERHHYQLSADAVLEQLLDARLLTPRAGRQR